MTLVKDVLARVARQCSISAPSSWLTAGDDEYLELRDDFLQQTAEDVLDRLDLPAPISGLLSINSINDVYSPGVFQVGVYDGSGQYTLPSDFRRLHRDKMAVYENGATRRACVPVSEENIWTHITGIGVAGTYRFYKLTGYEGNYSIFLYREPEGGLDVSVAYISNNWIANGGTLKSTFSDEADTTMIPRDVLEAGTILRWRERRGLPTDTAMKAYEVALARYSNDARSRRIVSFGGNDKMLRWQDVVPDTIPTA